MKRRGIIPLYTYILIFFSLTDIYLVTGIKLVYVFAVFLIPTLFKKDIRLNKLDLCLFFWYISYFFAIEHIISIKDFVIVAVGQIVLFVVYFYFKSITSIEAINKIIHWLEIFLALLVMVGTVQVFLYYLIGTTWGISHLTHGVGLPRMSGLSSEPDWYGVICMMCSICYFVNIASRKVVIERTIDKLVCILSTVMLLLSLTRAAWVGFASAGLVFLLINTKQNRVMKRRIIKYILFLVPPIVLIFAALYVAENPFVYKLLQRMNVFQWNSNDGGAMDTRVSAIKIMMYYFAQHPFTGNGVGSMAAISQNTDLLNSLGYYYEINAGRGNANLIITNLFDVGIFGTLSLVIFFFIIVKDLYVSYKKSNEQSVLIVLLLVVSLLVDFQFNNGLRQPYFWIFFGISNSLIRLKKQKGVLCDNCN